MQDRHSDKKVYFEEQYKTSNQYILPLIQKYKAIKPTTKVLEVGCGLGGNLKPFIDLKCQITGVDILESSIERAKIELDYDENDNLTLIAQDIYKTDLFKGEFDIIFMKDTLEHIPDTSKLIARLTTFLKSDGIIFQGFPPWCNPFGGHQQMCKSKILSKLPWFHILPRFMFKGTLQLFGESPQKVQSLLSNVYDTRISIQRFKKIIKKSELNIRSEQLYFINPNYEVKFGLKPRKLVPVLNIPYLRDFYTTTAYYILSK